MRPARILVVDDERGMLRAIERVLTPRHHVRSTDSPLEAPALAQSFRPDLAILDIRMPEVDGFELMARLRQEVPDLDVILMTGSITEPDRKLVRALREKAFYFIQKPFDSEVMQTLVERCLDLRRLEEENRRHTRRLEDELAEARVFQQGLLPQPRATVEGFKVDCRYIPCSELGGDFCDYAAAGKGRAAFIVADVSGHGASAAMMTAIVKWAFHATPGDGFDPLEVVQRIGAAIETFPPERFLSVFCARADARAGSLEFVNAGHPAGMLWRPERVGDAGGGGAGGGSAAGGARGAAFGAAGPELLEATGPILSPALKGMGWERGQVSFRHGERLLLYSDGVTEARVEDGLFGEERLIQTVRAIPQGGGALLDGLLDRIHLASGGRPQPDDLTLLAAGYD